MREDLKKKVNSHFIKRAEKDYETTHLNVPEQTRQLKKSPRKDISVTPKLEPANKGKKEEIAKPWKTKKITDKKDITIEIFAPEHKPQIVQPLKIEEIKPKQPKAESSKSIEEGRRSMPLITEKVTNYHYTDTSKHAQEDEEEDYLDEEIEEEEEDDQFN